MTILLRPHSGATDSHHERTNLRGSGQFNYTKPRLTLIQAGYYVVSLTVAGAIIGAFG